MGKLRRFIDLTKFFYVQRVKGFSVPDAPFFSSGNPEDFAHLLRQSKSYLEFGSGGSTMWAAKYGIPTLSVESDRFYAKAVEEKLPPTAKSKMLVPDVGVTVDWGFPLVRPRSTQDWQRWRRYIELPFEQIAQTGHPFPDLVLVDGRMRRACALETARQAGLAKKDLTIWFDDYGSRPHYHNVEQYLGQPTMNGNMAVFRVDGTTISVPVSAVDEAARELY